MKKIAVGIIVIVVIIVGFALFNGKNNSSSSEVIKIGLISGLTGEYAFFGESYKKGAMLAYEEYVKNNPDVNIEIFIEDDGFDTKKALGAYKKLTGINKIDALINGTTASINAIYDLVSITDMPVIQAGEQSIDPIDDNVFQIMPGNILSEIELGEYVKNEKYDDLTIVYTSHDTMVRFRDAFKEGFGGEVVEYKINPNETDVRSIAAKIMSKNPQAISFFMFPEQGALMISEILKIAKEKPQLIFDPNFQSGINDYKRILGNFDELNGSIVMTIVNNAGKDFANRYEDRYGEKTGIASTWGYDGFNLLMKAYNKDGKKWIKNIKNANFEGIEGKLVFNEVGIRKPQLEVKIIENGELDI